MKSQHPDDSGEDVARWAARILQLAAGWRSSRDGETRNQILGDLWTLLQLGLQKYVRAFSRRYGALGVEDVRDIAADKALDLLGRLDRQSWDPSASSPAQLCAFLASVARNGVVDLLRTRIREVPAGVPAESAPDEGEAHTVHLATLPAEPAEHARAIAECWRLLTPRARLVWFLRIFYELSSAQIARHLEVTSTPAAVDTMLLRCRSHMRECMMAKGFEPHRMPTGTFTTLWETMVKDPPR